jgi:hypothetical protein
MSKNKLKSSTNGVSATIFNAHTHSHSRTTQTHSNIIKPHYLYHLNDYLLNKLILTLIKLSYICFICKLSLIKDI